MMTEIANPELAKAMEEALECYGSAPPSEQSTCDWVISPLLLAVGYARRDMVSQVGNGGGGIPDYTVLPGTPYTWYLEAKDWSRSLDRSQEAVQALNYANARGHQWVVLSNGREWRLFDNHIQGIPDDKLVARAELTDPGFADFIVALGKSSVQSGGLAEYAATWRLREVLRQQLLAQDSRVVRAVTRVLRAETGLSSIRQPDVVRYFAEMLGRPPFVADQPEAQSDVTVCCELENSATGWQDTHSLAEMVELGSRLNYSRPSETVLPDGKCVAASNWRTVASEVVLWIGESCGLPPLPFSGSRGAKKRWFLNTSPVRVDGAEMKAHAAFHLGGQEVYMDTNQSTVGFVKRLCALCEAKGISPTDIRVRLMPHSGEN